jgi:hypothetical protein
MQRSVRHGLRHRLLVPRDVIPRVGSCPGLSIAWSLCGPRAMTPIIGVRALCRLGHTSQKKHARCEKKAVDASSLSLRSSGPERTGFPFPLRPCTRQRRPTSPHRAHRGAALPHLAAHATGGASSSPTYESTCVPYHTPQNHHLL